MKCLSIARGLGDRFKEEGAYNILGNGYARLGDFNQAIKCHSQHLSIAKELGDRAEEGCAYGNLGNAYKMLSNFKQAIEYQKKQLSIAKSLRDRDGEGRGYGNLGKTYQSLGDFKQAIEYHNQGLSIAKELRQRDGEAHAYGDLGIAYKSLGDFKQAIEYHNQRLKIAKELGDRAGEGEAYGNLGIAYDCLGDFKKAIKYDYQHLIIAKELRNRAGEGSAYGNLGIAYHGLGNFKQAIEYFNQQLSIAKQLGQRDEEGRGYGNLGNAYQSLGDFKQAIEYHNQALSIAKELGQRDGEGRAYCNLGNAYGSLGDFRQSIEYHNQGLSIAKELRQRDEERLAYCNLGIAYKNLGDFKQAIEYHNQGLSIAKELGQRDGEGSTYGNLGIAYHSLGDFKKAIECYNQDISIAKELGARSGEGRAYGNLGITYQSLRDFKQAIDCQNQCLIIAKEVGDRVGEGHAFYYLGSCFELLDSLHEALHYYQYSVRLYNELRALLQSGDVWKISFCDAYRHAYTALWRTFLRLEKTDEALCVAEQGRAQALVDLLKLQYDSELLAPESIEPELTITDLLSDTTTQTVFVALAPTSIYGYSAKKVKFIIDRKKWQVNITFLHSVRKDVFKENQIAARVTCENRSLEKLRKKLSPAKEFVQEAVKTSHDKNHSLRLFYDCVIGPIADLLEGDEIVIVPDGPLCLIPFAACVDEADKYLSEYTRIRIFPSLTSIKLITDCPEDFHSDSGALLMGDPWLEEVTNEKGEPIFSSLPCAREEVEEIGRMLKISPLTGKEATKEEVLRRIGSVALVHIAAHGNMENGEIALAPNPARTSKIPEEKDYILKMADVQAVKLRARLVVLSCCHSAQGKVTADGVIGIGRAFLAAGARSVLVSLWAIDDEASVALHRAVKYLRDSEMFGAVKYWAPFVLIGDDVTIAFGENQ